MLAPLGLDYIFNCIYQLARTSNHVSIVVVLSNKLIVVTPSCSQAWHGIVIGFLPLEFPR
jgi:hypothetical protein